MVWFNSAIFTEGILPFVLVFVLIFAILQKTKLLGDGKRQIDALVSLVIALILITVPSARDIIVGVVPWLAVGLTAFLVYLLLYGVVANESAVGQKWQKIVFGIIAAVFVIGVIIFVTGFDAVLAGWFSGSGGDVWINILLVAIIAGVVALAIATGKKEGTKKD